MSRAVGDREGLSPSPATDIDFMDEDEDNDELYEPASEQSELTESTAEDEEENEFEGAYCTAFRADQTLISRRCTRTARVRDHVRRHGR